MPELRKRETAYKVRIGDLLRGNQIFEQSSEESTNPRLLYVELGDKKIVRVNIIANVIDKFESQGDTRFASITLDDGSGQIRARVFGNEITKFQDISQGDTVAIIGFLRSFNQELYVLPEITRKQDQKYLLIRKIEIENEVKPLTSEQKEKIKAFREQIIDIVKEAEKKEGIEKDEIILNFKNTKPGLISMEIQKLLEDGIFYEPRPGKVRYMG